MFIIILLDNLLIGDYKFLYFFVKVIKCEVNLIDGSLYFKLRKRDVEIF